MKQNRDLPLGAGVLAIQDGRVLLVQLNYGRFAGQWILPGGSVNVGEHPHFTAVREFKEETGLDVGLSKLLVVRNRIYEDQSVNTYFVFEGKILTPNPQENLQWPEEELKEVRFWNVEDAIQSKEVRPHTRSFIEFAQGKAEWPAIASLDGDLDDVVYVGNP